MIVKVKNTLNINRNYIYNYEINILRQVLIARYGDSNWISYVNQNMFFLAPFTDSRIAFRTFLIPSKFKKNRKLTIRMIKLLSPELANYPFLSHLVNPGDSLTDINEIKEKPLWNMKKALIPASLISFKNKIKNYKKRNETLPFYLNEDFLISVFGDDDFVLRKYFNLNKCMNIGILNRFYNLELLIRKYDISV